MHPRDQHLRLIESELKKLALPSSPHTLYEPIRYMLSIGGKRMRPLLVLMGCGLFKGNIAKALYPALAIEVFHNFTLLHDDIMDKATLRRSNQTVHVKWNESTAILAGDAMFVKAVQLMMKTDAEYVKTLLDNFTDTALKVCEGQQLDMDFETRNDVSIDSYLHMIECKTAVLLGCALKTGAVIAGASEDDSVNIYNAGVNLGMAFQLQDDLLDLYGDESRFGKKKGGDITSNKKTFLVLKALEMANTTQRESIQSLYQTQSGDKVNSIKSLFDALDVAKATEATIESYYSKAISQLDGIPVEEKFKGDLYELAESLRLRVI